MTTATRTLTVAALAAFAYLMLICNPIQFALGDAMSPAPADNGYSPYTLFEQCHAVELNIPTGGCAANDDQSKQATAKAVTTDSTVAHLASRYACTTVTAWTPAKGYPVHMVTQNGSTVSVKAWSFDPKQIGGSVRLLCAK